MADLRAVYINKLISLPLADRDGRDEAHLSINILDRLPMVLTSYVENGKLEARLEKNKQKAKE